MRKKYLYLISRTDEVEYDEYDSAVVVASSQDMAKNIHPNGLYFFKDEKSWRKNTTWCKSPKEVTVKKIGVADDHLKMYSVVCASFNAG